MRASGAGRGIGRALAPSLLAASLAIAPLGAASAQDNYPSRAVTIIVPFAAGGPSDVLARLLAERLSAQLKQPFVIENKLGASGAIGVSAVARASPDGYTLLLVSAGPMSITPLTRTDAGFHPINDLTAIAGLTSQPSILLVLANSPYKTLAQLVEAGKKPNAKIFYGSVGVGSWSHFATELLNAELGTHFSHIPYSGSAPAIQALMSGEIDLYFAAAVDGITLTKAGTARAFLTTYLKRSPDAPDVPALEESGLKQPDMDNWQGLFGPAKMPPQVVAKLNAAIQTALLDPAFQAKVIGARVTPGTPADFAKLVADTYANLKKAVEVTGFKP